MDDLKTFNIEPPQQIERDLILLVDDDQLILNFLSEIAERVGCLIVQASSLEEARKAISQENGFAAILCDQLLPDGCGLDFFREIKGTHPHTVRILITGFPETKLALEAINQGEIFRFIAKPTSVEAIKISIHDALERYHLIRENQRLQASLLIGNEQLQKANTALHQSLSNSAKFCLDILDRFDHLVAGHSSRVAKWAVAVGNSLNLSSEELDTLEVAARMHDLGLISVSRDLHRYQQLGLEHLQPMEQAALYAHSKTGAELVQFLDQKGVPEIIMAHHEWFNGGGYPAQIAHEQIPFLTSILSVPDAYDEVPLEHSESAKFVEDNLGVRFHPDVGRAFLRLLMDRPEYAQREREVLISELQPGMKLTWNLFSATGVLLAPAGEVLSPKLIQYILQHNNSDPLTQRIFIAA